MEEISKQVKLSSVNRKKNHEDVPVRFVWARVWGWGNY